MIRKLVGVLTVVFVASGLASSLHAGIDTTLRQWKDVGKITDQDKIYTFGSTDLDLAIGVSFDLDVFPTEDIHQVTVDKIGSGTWFLEYTITIDPLSDFYFKAVSLGSNVPGSSPDVLVEKFVSYDGGPLFTLSSLSGAADGPDLVFPVLTKELLIRDVFKVDTGVVSGTGILNSTTNTFTQARVPEPASIVSFGGLALLMGVVMMRRRKRA